MRITPAQYIGQAISYGLFMAFIGYLSVDPEYLHFPEDQALIKLSISHAGQIKGECRELTKEELAALPPNMRKTTVCPRERSPVQVELFLDEKPIYSASLAPSGIKSDGISHTYQTFSVPTGAHRLVARLKDLETLPDFNYVREADIELAGRQVFVIDFHEKSGGFVLR